MRHFTCRESWQFQVAEALSIRLGILDGSPIAMFSKWNSKFFINTATLSFLTIRNGRTSRTIETVAPSTHFITISCYVKKRLLQSDRMAGLFVDVLQKYRFEQKMLVHEFVVMPDHVHLLITLPKVLRWLRRESKVASQHVSLRNSIFITKSGNQASLRVLSGMEKHFELSPNTSG